jgi:DNA-binding NtrC family response regulator
MGLEDLNILVLEDIFLLADMLCDLLEESGCNVVGPASRVEGALKLIAQTPRLDGALLDVNLVGEFSFPVAAVLSERNVPFIFMTGYGDATMIPPEFRSAPRLTKPFDLTRLTSLAAEHFSHRLRQS